MLTPTTVSGLRPSLICVVRLEPHHQSLGYVVISITDQTPQLLLLSSILGERLQSQFLTTFSLSSTDGSLLTK